MDVNTFLHCILTSASRFDDTKRMPRQMQPAFRQALLEHGVAASIDALFDAVRPRLGAEEREHVVPVVEQGFDDVRAQKPGRPRDQSDANPRNEGARR